MANSTGVNREATQPRLVRVELRCGNRTGAAHGDGRRGHIFAQGEVDEEWPRWFAKALRQHPVPSHLGPFYVYAGSSEGAMECVWTNAATTTEQVVAGDAQGAADLASFGSLSTALAQRRVELAQAETRSVVLHEQITATEARVARLQRLEEQLEQSLADERARVKEEKASLGAEIKAVREHTRTEKAMALADLVETTRVVRENMTANVTHITALTEGLMMLECKTAENTMARRSLGHSHLQENLDRLDELEDSHRLALGGPAKETAADRLANALAVSIEKGTIVHMIGGVAQAIRGKPVKRDDDDDDDDGDD